MITHITNDLDRLFMLIVSYSQKYFYLLLFISLRKIEHLLIRNNLQQKYYKHKQINLWRQQQAKTEIV